MRHNSCYNVSCLSVFTALTITSRPFHAGPTLQALDSEYKNKKTVSSTQQTELVEDDLLGLAGFTE